MYAQSFEISAFLLSLFCFLYCLVAKRKQYVPPKGFLNRLFNQHFQFLMMLAMNMISSASSVIGVYLTTLSGGGVLAFWQYFFHALYFIFHTTLSLAFGLYIIAVTGTNIKKHKVALSLFFIPYIAAEVLVLTNQWTNLCFYMDANSIYHRGPLMLLLYGLAGFYVVMGFVFFFRNMKAITLTDRLAVGVFILIASAGIITQAVRSDWLVELFFEALACLVIMMVLEEKAGHIDQMTGLLNRFAFSDNVRLLLASKESFDLVVIKIDGIAALVKRFNERTADGLLLQLATYLSQISGQGSVYAYRRGEFMAVFKTLGEDASSFASRVVERLRKPWKLNRMELSVDGVAAVVRAPEDIRDLDGLEDFVAAYATYQKNLEGPYLLSPREVSTMIQARYYEEELRKAVNEKRLQVYYQPIYSISKKRTVSAEALLRVTDDPFKDISPDLYISIAEKTGIIREIGLYVFEDVCRVLAEKRKEAEVIRYIELNLSVYQFLDANLVDDFEAIRSRYGVSSDQINLEITETGGALEKEEVVKALNRFKELGYTLSLDDFGTGYSNFVRMVRCKFENIKIDKSILWDLGQEANGAETLKSLSSFIKLQGSSIVQEGVETTEQLAFVESYGADYVQGYYFGKPMPIEDFYAYLEQEGQKH